MRSPSMRRRWAPDCIKLATAESPATCRVCSQPIAAGEQVLRRVWQDCTLSHVRCGWFCSRDARMEPDINREAREAIEKARVA